MEVAPQGCINVINQKTKNKINWVRIDIMGLLAAEVRANSSLSAATYLNRQQIVTGTRRGDYNEYYNLLQLTMHCNISKQTANCYKHQQCYNFSHIIVVNRHCNISKQTANCYRHWGRGLHLKSRCKKKRWLALLQQKQTEYCNNTVYNTAAEADSSNTPKLFGSWLHLDCMYWIYIILLRNSAFICSEAE